MRRSFTILRVGIENRLCSKTLVSGTIMEPMASWSMTLAIVGHGKPGGKLGDNGIMMAIWATMKTWWQLKRGRQ